MFDSYTADKMSNLEPCQSCGKVDCDCDEQTMQAMEQDDEDRQHESEPDYE